jgi:hypothetical protein
MLKRIVLSCCVTLLILCFSQIANADTITAQLTVRGFGGFPNFPLIAKLDAVITLEPSPGPFWWPWYTDYLPEQNGYLVTSLTGTWNTVGNGNIDEPATLAPIDPLRPYWMEGSASGDGFFSGYLAWRTPTGFGGFHNEISRIYISFSGSPGFAEGSASAVTVPEPLSVSLMGLGIVGVIMLGRRKTA